VSVRKDRRLRRLSRVLIANRGEIAVRIARTLREMGSTSIAVYSEADADAVHVTMADEAVLIGPTAPAASYLNIPALIAAARATKADAIHPGYGFLSESATFARAVQKAGLTWIGPTPETQELLGNKLAARRAVADAGVPIVPGLLVAVDATRPGDATEVGYPAMLKAAAGGGGRGMRRVEDARQLAAALFVNGRPGDRRRNPGAERDQRVIGRRMEERRVELPVTLPAFFRRQRVPAH